MKKTTIFLCIVYIILCLCGLDQVSLIAIAFAFTFLLGYINKNSMVSLITSLYFLFIAVSIYLYKLYDLNYFSLIISGFVIFVPGIIFPLGASKRDRIKYRFLYNIIISLGTTIALIGFLKIDSISFLFPLIAFSFILYLLLNKLFKIL